MSRTWVVSIFAIVALATTSAQAESVKLQFDLNSLTIQAKDSTGANVFNGVNHTGMLVLGMNANSTLDVGIEGNWNVGYNAALHSVAGQIDLFNGAVSGGSMSVTVLNADSTFDSYAFDLVPGSGSVTRPAGNFSFSLKGYQLLADSSGGTLTDANFGGVNVGLWYNQQPLLGTLMQIRYKPDANGFAAGADVDLTAVAVVPLPRPVLAGAVLFAGLFAWRFRQSRRLAVEG